MLAGLPPPDKARLEPRARCPRLSLTPDKEAIGKAAAGGAPRRQGDVGALSLPPPDKQSRRLRPRPLSPHRRVRPPRLALVEWPLPLNPTRSGGQPPAQEPAQLWRSNQSERASGSRDAPEPLEGAQRSDLPPTLALWTWHPQQRFLGSRGILGQVPEVSKFWETILETRQTPGAEVGRGTSVSLGAGSKCGSRRDMAMSAGGRGGSVRL